MERMKSFIKAIKYSIKLIYDSSKFMIIVYFILSILGRTLPLLNIFIFKNILDELTLEQLDIFVIIIYIFLYIGIIIFNQAISSANAIIDNSISEKAGHRYDVELSKKLTKLPMSVIDTSSGKDLIDDVKYTKNFAINLIQRIIFIISGFYSFIIAFISLITFNVWISLLFLLLSVPIIIVDIIFDRKSDNLRRKMAPDVRKFSYYRWMLTDTWPAKDVRMYDLTDTIKERYDTEKDTYRQTNRKLDQKKLKTSLLIEIIKHSGEIIFTAFVIFQAIDGKITIGDIALYTGFAFSASGSFQGIVPSFIFCYTTYTDRIKRVLEFIKIDCPDESGAVRKIDKFESLTFDNVYFKYPFAENYVLQGTSFTLNAGDKLSIIGINGAGKSTIIKLMLGLYKIDSGQILINGYPLSDYDIKDIRKMFSILFQKFVQYPLSLRDNIALSDLKKQYDNEAIIKVIKQSGIYENYDKFENGLESYMTRQFDDDGIELSMGQWQKIALSRAYFKNASIIIFDEPSAALDAEAEDKIFDNFKNISENKTGIMISHRISSAKMSNKIIVVDHGKIIESGTHENLIALNGFYAKLYNLQMEKYTVKEA